MKIVLRLFFPLLCMLPIVATAQTNSYMNNPMVRVTMETYAAMLRENPQDYTIYYSRGKDYYQYGDYDKALTDLDAAIRYFPRPAASDLSQAYTIRGLIK